MADFLSWDKQQWLAHLESVHPSEIELGLERVKLVAERLDCLKPAAKVIVLAGTNGKGTTSAMLSALLAKPTVDVDGKVHPPRSSALYNSPHISQYNERVSLNRFGEFRHVYDGELLKSFAAVEQARGDIKLTYFEFGTLAALYQIKQWQVDVAILEIGLGGRLDAVNIVDTDIAVITSIGLDHQDWLGDTVEKIGFEKAGIARKDKPLICGQLDAPLTVLESANEHGAKLYQAVHLNGQAYQGSADASSLAGKFSIVEHKSSPQVLVTLSGNEAQKIQLTLPKPHIPTANLATALQVLALMDSLPSMEVIAEVVSELRVFGRMMRYCCQYQWQNELKHFELVLDVAHNPQAAGELNKQVNSDAVAVLAMLADKDASAVVSEMNKVGQWFLAPIENNSRSQTAKQLQESLGLREKAVSYDSVAEALEQACLQVSDEGQLVVFGSFFTIEAALQALDNITGLKFERL